MDAGAERNVDHFVAAVAGGRLQTRRILEEAGGHERNCAWPTGRLARLGSPRDEASSGMRHRCDINFKVGLIV